ncbi:hypothetical protein [Sphingomonas sp. PWP1-2]|uniref:hypothetical protein n=1 Tax=Sphingomonas sp. PWP1-2 TaxID=2804558 RepID=UPI003CF6EB6B
MKIDLNSSFTSDDVVALLASEDDSKNRQIRVTGAGIAYISDVVGNNDIAGLAFRLPTWNAGNDYTGVRAAADTNFVARVENALRSNWPIPASTYIDVI